MEEEFQADFFAGNRQKLRTLFSGQAPIVLTANGLLQQAADTTFPFRQDGSFWYLTGIDEPDIVLVLDREKEYLIVPERSQAKQTFDGGIDFEQLVQISGVEQVLDEQTGWKKLSAKIKRSKHVATLAPPAPYIDVLGFYTNPARNSLVSRLKEINSAIELLDLRQHIAVMRMVKQPVELAELRQSIDITAKAFKDVRKKLNSFDNEYQVEAALGYGFRRRGASGHAYFPIVAGGKNACTIHYEANNQVLQNNQLLLIDAGAVMHHYGADISRTYSLGNISKRQTSVYDAVLAVWNYAISLLKPGVVVREYEKRVEQFMGEKLRELGLIKTVETDEVRRYFPHATSHFLGLDVHDAGDYDRPLEPGVVLTVEPGIYIPQEAIGIRLEDDVLITDGGAEILSSHIPKEL